MGIARHRLAQVTALIAVAALAALVLAGRGDSRSGAASASQSTSAEELSAQLSANDLALRAAIDAWRDGGDPPTTPPPPDVMASARYLQGAVRSLARHRTLAKNTIALLTSGLGHEVSELTAAARDLNRLSAGWPPHHVQTGKPRSLAELTKYYDAAFRRHEIGQHYLAAIHFVESKFGRVKSNSVAGAQGPMQFLPSTWDIYGHGDIHDDHDAILAAANLLRHNGAPGDYRRALHAYNPSGLYVDAVQRYARLIKGDRYAVYFLYCWRP